MVQTKSGLGVRAAVLALAVAMLATVVALPASASGPSQLEQQLADDLFEAINEARVNAGLAPVERYHDDSYAYQRALDQKEKLEERHEGFDDAQYVEYRAEEITFTGEFAERRMGPRRAVYHWLRSVSHAPWMLAPEATKVAVAMPCPNGHDSVATAHLIAEESFGELPETASDEWISDPDGGASCDPPRDNRWDDEPPPVSTPRPPRPLGGVCDGAPSRAFHDVDAATHRVAIDCLASWNITHGVAPGRYDPHGQVTRQQMASFIARTIQATGGQLPASGPSFPDAAGTHSGPIRQLAGAGIVTGFTDGTYRPTEQVTRGQMATFLVRAYEYRAGSALSNGPNPFTDVTQGHQTAVNKANRAGLATGNTDGTFRGSDPVSRQQMASFIARLLAALDEDGHTNR